MVVFESLKKRRRGVFRAVPVPPELLDTLDMVQAVSRGIALNMVQKWLGHAQLTTTAISANAVGEEEQRIAVRMW